MCRDLFLAQTGYYCFVLNWHFTMKRRCKESQPSVQNFFSLPSKRRAGEEQICENSQDIARPAAIAAVSADQCDSPEALADISDQEPSVDDEVTIKASLLQDASDGRFTDIGVCWKGLSSGGLPHGVHLHGASQTTRKSR